ncbi:hypothetical protein [Methylobacterium trifolii]|uniref:CopG family transcriptional regulator n=1 Tax=Methylobacterium trifolii TaxID=1003092 RepID=A0ABQ4U3M9_9HYPH|nr:hypothetical protein [Methylobacterium trifolii]GJE62069.1 hypothetical protein MPOCJGCO_4198 [Methylobacterium trifolii]
MALNTKPKALRVEPSDAAFDRVVAKASDVRAQAQAEAEPRKGIWKGKKRAISHTIAPELLNEVDALAARRHQTRTAFINGAIFDAIERSK